MNTSAAAPTPPPRRRTRWALAGGLLLAVAVFYALGLQRHFSWEAIRANLGGWKAQVETHLVVAVVVYFLVYLAVTALSLPVATWLSLLGGALFGRWVGTGTVSLAATLGATLAFLSSRYILGAWVQERFGARLEPLQRGIERDGAFYLLTLRLIPLFPFFLVNLGMGLTRMRTPTYAAVSWLGMLPATFIYVNAGKALGDVEHPRDLISFEVTLSLALIGLLPLALRFLLRRRVPESP